MPITISRSLFFGVLFLCLVAPFSLVKLYWISNSKVATGQVLFTGHGNLGSVLGLSTYQVIMFKANEDSVYFNGNLDFALKDKQTIEVRYQPANPTDAKVNSFIALWSDTLIYSIGPLLVFLAIFFVPEVVPRHSRIQFGSKPFIKIVTDKINPSLV